MAPCKFYLQGNCKFGDRCKFDHPGAHNRGNQQNQNRFSALSNANTGGQGARGGQRGGGRQEYKFNLDPAVIQQDLANDRPIWPLSVYAPARLGPRHLIEGPVMEQSFEEMRLRYYAAMRSGNPQQAAQEETQLGAQMNQQIQNILSNLDGACQYVQDGENIHPNRLDIPKQAGQPGGYQNQPQQQQQQQQPGAFGQSNAAFGQPSAFGAAAKPVQGTAFGQPSAFGAAAGQQQSAFGRPSAFGAAAGQQPAQSAFGAPSALGGANPAFGKPAFGAPSAFGQAANPGTAAGSAPAFGQPSQPGAFGQPGGGAFGAKPAFGQPAGGTAFGQPSQPGGAGAFGKPAGAPGFGQPAFGQAAQPAASSPFGQLGQQQQQQQQQQGGFGQATNQQQGSGAFGQQQPAASAFGQAAAKPSPFGALSQPQPSNAFGAPAQQASASPFSQPAANGFSAPQSNGFSQQQQQQQQPSNIGAGVPGVVAGADISTYTTRRADGQLTSFKGQPVQYFDGEPSYRRPDNGQWERIWLPDGPQAENPYAHAEPQVYGEALREAYEYLSKTGTFKDGIMPEEPPPHALCGFDV